MNKDIKLLIESFFDDMFDEHDDINNSTLIPATNIENQTHDLISKTLYEPMKLTDCISSKDIITCYKENSKFIQWYEKYKDDIVRSLRSQKENFVNSSIAFVKEPMLPNHVKDGTVDINYDCIIEHTVFGLSYSYTFVIEKAAAYGYNQYNMYMLILRVSRVHSSFTQKIHVDELFIADKNNNIVNDWDLFEKIRQNYKVHHLSIEENISRYILPVSACRDIMNQINHKPQVYPITKRDITIMSHDKSQQKLSNFNHVNTVIPKICAYCIAKDKLDLFEWNTTNLATWSLGIHELQYYIDNMFNGPGAMCIYFKDLIASVKNYMDKKK